MPDLPVMLRVAGKRCVIVGSGPVAHRRAAALRQAGANVTVIAKMIDQQSQKIFKNMNVQWLCKSYQTGDLNNVALVVIATDDPMVNQQIASDANTAGILTNRADNPSQGDLAIPAHTHRGPVTVAVYTGGLSATAAATIRNELLDAFDADWLKLLEVVGPFRKQIQATVANGSQRRAILKQLTDEQAMAKLKQEGQNAFQKYCRQKILDLVANEPSDCTQ